VLFPPSFLCTFVTHALEDESCHVMGLFLFLPTQVYVYRGQKKLQCQDWNLSGGPGRSHTLIESLRMNISCPVGGELYWTAGEKYKSHPRTHFLPVLDYF
jgi:hypothetical protein